MTDIERKSKLLITLNNEYVKSITLEKGSQLQVVHENTCFELLVLAGEMYGLEFRKSCLDFLSAIDDAVELWKRGESK